MIKTKKEIIDKIREIRRVEGRCFANAEVAGGWLDGLGWVLQQEGWSCPPCSIEYGSDCCEICDHYSG